MCHIETICLSLDEDKGTFYEPKVDDKSYKSKINQLEFLSTVGTGTFGRVIVVRNKTNQEYYALKIMSIMEVLRLKQTEHVKNEKDILSEVSHPFIINLYVKKLYFFTNNTDFSLQSSI